MLSQDSKTKIVRESIIGEIISILGNLLAGMVMVFLLVPFESFIYLIIMIPPLLTLRGNIGGSFTARLITDLYTGELSKKLQPIGRWVENIGATVFISTFIAIFIGFISQLFSILLGNEIFSLITFLLIPLFTIIFDLVIIIPVSTFLIVLCFYFGVDPNNIVNSVTTSIDDFLIAFGFYISLILLGVS